MGRHRPKRLLVSAAVLGAAVVAAAAQVADSGLVRIEVTGARVDSGVVAFALFDDEASWLGDSPVRSGTVPVKAGQALIELAGLPPGVYGVSVFLDENGNGELDTGLFGAPTEPFGFSNDAPARFGPAKWSDAAFELRGEEVELSIRLRTLF